MRRKSPLVDGGGADAVALVPKITATLKLHDTLREQRVDPSRLITPNVAQLSPCRRLMYLHPPQLP